MWRLVIPAIKCHFKQTLITSKYTDTFIHHSLEGVFYFLWQFLVDFNHCLNLVTTDLWNYDNHMTESHNRFVHNMGKCTFGIMRTAKTLIRLRNCAVWSGSSLWAYRSQGSLAINRVPREDWSDCADAQADPSLCRLHMPEGTFSNVEAQLIIKVIGYIWNFSLDP